MITLKNKRLTVQIQTPGQGYQRTRFDWSGICEQITLDEAVTYLSQEATPGNLGTEGVGVSDEFGITTAIGYDEIAVGEWFPKIGVGFLQKVNTESYSFMFDYPLQAVPIEVLLTGDTEVGFVQKSKVMAGWGWKLQKSFSLHGPNLTLDYTLENIGEKPLFTEQYNHNFSAINEHTIGPDYQLQTSFPLACELIDGGMHVKGDTLNLTEVPPEYIYAAQSDCQGLENIEWTLRHQPTEHGIRAREQFPLLKFALWARSHVISPEAFIAIDLKPGETQTWRRAYTFF